MGFLIAAAIILLLLCLRLSVRILVSDTLEIYAVIGIIRVRLYPKKEKELRLRDFGIERFKKRLGVSDEKRLKKSKKVKKKTKDTELETTSADETEEESIFDLIEKISRTASDFAERFGSRLRIKLRRFVIVIGSDDPAKTALLYGAAVGAVQTLYALLCDCGTLRVSHGAVLDVLPDFACEKSRVEADLTLSLTVGQLLNIALHTLITYLRDPADENA